MLQYQVPTYYPRFYAHSLQMNNTTLGGTYCSHQNLSDRQEGRTLGSLLALSLFHDQDLSIDVRFVVQGCRL